MIYALRSLQVPPELLGSWEELRSGSSMLPILRVKWPEAQLLRVRAHCRQCLDGVTLRAMQGGATAGVAPSFPCRALSFIFLKRLWRFSFHARLGLRVPGWWVRVEG